MFFHYNHKNWSLCILRILMGQVVLTGNYLPGFYQQCQVTWSFACSYSFRRLWRLKHFISWTSVAWRLSGNAEGIYIPSIVHTLFFLILFELIWIEKNKHSFWRNFKMTFSCYKRFKLLEELSFQSFNNLMQLF